MMLEVVSEDDEVDTPDEVKDPELEDALNGAEKEADELDALKEAEDSELEDALAGAEYEDEIVVGA